MALQAAQRKATPPAQQRAPTAAASRLSPTAQLARQSATVTAAPRVRQLQALQNSIAQRRIALPGAPVVQAVFTHPDLGELQFSTHAKGAAPADRSIYFQQGRIRLAHPAGPTVEKHDLDRYTFAKKHWYSSERYEKRDFLAAKARGENPVDSGIVKPARAGSGGTLYEYKDKPGGGYSNHLSRGTPIAEKGIKSDEHLDRIHRIASAADRTREVYTAQIAGLNAKMAGLKSMADVEPDPAEKTNLLDERADVGTRVLETKNELGDLMAGFNDLITAAYTQDPNADLNKMASDLRVSGAIF